jgi:hypothetical protein
VDVPLSIGSVERVEVCVTRGSSVAVMALVILPTVVDDPEVDDDEDIV